LRLAIEPGECGNVWEQAEKAVAADSVTLEDGVREDISAKARDAILWYWDHDRVKENYPDSADYIFDVMKDSAGTITGFIDLEHPDLLPKEWSVQPPAGCPDPTAQFN